MAPLRRADSIRRTAQICPPSHSDEERSLARAEPSARGGLTPGQTRPVKAVSRRSRARGARALTGVGWSGSALAKCQRRGNVEPGSVSWTRCAELLCAKQNLDFCKLAHARKIAISLCTVTRSTAAHPAPLSCYQAVDVSRLAGPALSFAKPAMGQKTRTSMTRPDPAHVHCSRHAKYLVTTRAKHVGQIDPQLTSLLVPDKRCRALSSALWIKSR